MNALKTLIIAAALLVLPPPTSRAQEQAADTNVVIAFAPSRDTLAPGSGGEVLFTFKPKKGFHVNAVPPVAVAFDSSAPATNGGGAVIPSDTTTGYLKPSLPVRQPFTIDPSARKGRTELSGTLTYYYCSEAEGWCRKEHLRFSVPVTVK